MKEKGLIYCSSSCCAARSVSGCPGIAAHGVKMLGEFSSFLLLGLGTHVLLVVKGTAYVVGPSPRTLQCCFSASYCTFSK